MLTNSSAFCTTTTTTTYTSQTHAYILFGLPHRHSPKQANIQAYSIDKVHDKQEMLFISMEVAKNLQHIIPQLTQ